MPMEARERSNSRRAGRGCVPLSEGRRDWPVSHTWLTPGSLSARRELSKPDLHLETATSCRREQVTRQPTYTSQQHNYRQSEQTPKQIKCELIKPEPKAVRSASIQRKPDADKYEPLTANRSRCQLKPETEDNRPKPVAVNRASVAQKVDSKPHEEQAAASECLQPKQETAPGIEVRVKSDLEEAAAIRITRCQKLDSATKQISYSWLQREPRQVVTRKMTSEQDSESCPWSINFSWVEPKTVTYYLRENEPDTADSAASVS